MTVSMTLSTTIFHTEHVKINEVNRVIAHSFCLTSRRASSRKAPAKPYCILSEYVDYISS